jgi:hypothetical protein
MKIQTSGSCSPVVTGSGNTINIKMCGMTDAQAGEFRDLLRQILVNQSNVKDLIPVLRELNSGQLRIENGVIRIEGAVTELQKQGAPRALNSEQRRRIIVTLANLPGSPEIKIRATNSNAESARYAEQLRDAFATTPGWSVPPVFLNMVVGSALPTGLIGVVHDTNSIYGIAIQRLFRELSIPIEFSLDPTLPENVVILAVFQKPIS